MSADTAEVYGQYKCHLCGGQFRSKSELERHMQACKGTKIKRQGEHNYLSKNDSGRA